MYEFRLRAVNSAGEAEKFSDKTETFTYILATCTGDDAESSGDNKRTNAPRATAGVAVMHNWSRLVMWIGYALTLKRVTASCCGRYRAATLQAAVIQLYAAGSDVLLGEARPVNPDSNAVLTWLAPKDGVYAVRLTPADARIAGVEAVYDFTVEKKSSVKPLWFVIFSAMISALMGGSYVAAKKVQKSMKQKKSRHVGW